MSSEQHMPILYGSCTQDRCEILFCFQFSFFRLITELLNTERVNELDCFLLSLKWMIVLYIFARGFFTCLISWWQPQMGMELPPGRFGKLVSGQWQPQKHVADERLEDESKQCKKPFLWRAPDNAVVCKWHTEVYKSDSGPIIPRKQPVVLQMNWTVLLADH